MDREASVSSLEEQGGWLTGVRRRPSPNQDTRPPGTAINLLVIHGISLPPGCYGEGYIDRLFVNTLNTAQHPRLAGLNKLQVSAHFLIERDGALTQYVPLHRRAWHAGESCFQGRPRCNDYSIGIELEGTDNEPYETPQYHVLTTLTHVLQRLYPALSQERIVGHSDIAPGRKTDPGPSFDWQRYRGMLDQPGVEDITATDAPLLRGAS